MAALIVAPQRGLRRFRRRSISAVNGIFTRAVKHTRVKSFNELVDRLYADSWQPHLGRFRSNFAFRGMQNAAADLTTSLARLGGPFARQEGHLLRNFRKYAQ